MVNQVFHKFYASPADTSEDTESEIELNLASPDISPTCFPDLLSKNQTEKTGVPFSNIFSTRFRPVISTKGTPKNGFNPMEKFLLKMAGERPLRFSLKQIQSFTRNFSNKIGDDGFGQVYKGLMPNGVPVSVKLLYVYLDDQPFMAEVSILSNVYHRNIVKLFGYCVEGGVRALVYEYMPNGSLHNYLFNNHNSLDWEMLLNIAIGIAKGISYLQEECPEVIIHGDIKPSNILLGSNFSPKLAGFGLVLQYDMDEDDGIHVDCIPGTFEYLDPNCPRFTCKSDVFSFGMVLFDILGRPKPSIDDFQDYKSFPQQVWDKIKLGNTEYCKEQTGRMSMAALWCSQDKLEDRPSMSTVVNILEGDNKLLLPPLPLFLPIYEKSCASSGSASFTSRSGGISEINSIYSDLVYSDLDYESDSADLL